MIFSVYELRVTQVKGKMFWKYCNISKTLWRDSITPLSPLYHGVGRGVNLRVRPKVKTIKGTESEQCLK